MGSVSALQGKQASRRRGRRALCPGRGTSLLEAHPGLEGLGRVNTWSLEPLRYPNPSATPMLSVVQAPGLGKPAV